MCERCQRNTSYALAACTGGGPADGDLVPILGAEMVVPVEPIPYDQGLALDTECHVYRLRQQQRTGVLEYQYLGVGVRE